MARSARPIPAPPPMGDLARDMAIRALARQARAFPDLAPDALDQQVQSRLSAAAPAIRPLDIALAQSIYTATVGRWLTLAWLLHREIRQGFDALEPRVRAVLLAGAAQLVFLDRVPAHAAINHAVEWAKSAIRPGAGGLVNAVLRRVASRRAGWVIEAGPWSPDLDALPLSNGRMLRGAGVDLPADPRDRLAIATSCPRTLLDHWGALIDQDRLVRRSLHALVVPPLVLNLEHATDLPSDQLARLPLRPHAEPHHAVVADSATQPPASILASLPGAFVQDAAAAGAVRSVADVQPPPRFIVDLCAGRGTKTRQLAAMFPDAGIIATDTSAHRLAALREAFAGSPRINVLPYAEARDRALGRADLVVADVPCTNTGVLPRRPEARYRFGPESLAALAAIQRQILADSIPLLAPAGGSPRRILYSTCSLEPQENADQHRWMHRWHRFAAERERLTEPSGQPGDNAAEYRDGAYSVVLAAP